jgi:hypothetical protein
VAAENYACKTQGFWCLTDKNYVVYAYASLSDGSQWRRTEAFGIYFGVLAMGGTMRGIAGLLSNRCGGRAVKTHARGRRTLALTVGFIVAVLAVFGMAPHAQAASIPLVQFFYVPFPEDQVLTMLTAVNATNPVNPVTSYVTITAVADDTVIVYDQWENGYDVDLTETLDTYSSIGAEPNLDGTQIWGDHNVANGAPPGVSTDLGDAIDSGTVINLESEVQTATRQSDIDFDGGDKFAANKTIAVTRTTWAAGSGTLFAGCVEVFDTNNWGTDYRAPIGTNAANSYQMFEYTALSIMAGEDNTTVSVDLNNDGDYVDAGERNQITLDQGGTNLVTGVRVGTHVVSTKKVQVDIFSGDVGSNYESRDSALMPTSMWASRYYTPVSTADVPVISQNDGRAGDERTTVWLFNPGATSMYVTYKYRNATGDVVIGSTLQITANGVNKRVLENVTDGSGAFFYASNSSGVETTGNFYAYSTTDSASATQDQNGGYTNNQAFDWSFTLIPDDMLTTQALIGLGIGRDPNSTFGLHENGNPVWVTTVGNGDTPANVYVDYDADPTTGRFTDTAQPTFPDGHTSPDGTSTYRYDAKYSLRELDQARVYRPAQSAATGVVAGAQNSATTGTSASSTLTLTHNSGTAQNRLLLVSVAIGNRVGAEGTVQSVTFGGIPLTRVGSQVASRPGADDPNSVPRVEIWGLANPPRGSATVAVTLSSSRPFAAEAMTFSGVDVADGLASALNGAPGSQFFSGAGSAGTDQWVNPEVSTQANQVVYGVVAASSRDAYPGAFSATSGQLINWTQQARGGNNDTLSRLRAAGGTVTATGTSTPVTWSATGSLPWAVGAVAIKPMPAGTVENQTGILLYTLSTSVKLAVAWGQDPWTATPGEPGVDVGTSVPPMPEYQAAKDGKLWDSNPLDGFIDGDLATPPDVPDGYLGPGDVMEYPITVYNVSRLPVPNVYVWDHAPDPVLYDTTYVLGSTVLSKDNNGDGTYESVTPVSDDPTGTPFPLDNINTAPAPKGLNVGTLPVGGEYKVTFRVTLDQYANLIPNTLAILNGGKAFALGLEDPVDDMAFITGRISDYVWFDTNGDGVQDAGEPPIGGVVVQLLDGSGNTLYDLNGDVKQVATDETGLYQFLGLPSTTYKVRFIAPLGMEFTTPDLGNASQTIDVANDSDAKFFTTLPEPEPVTNGDTAGDTAQITLGGGQKNPDIDAGLKLKTPTLAVVSSFGTYALGGKVVVNWVTASETNTAGYDVQRLDPSNKKWVKVNNGVVPALFESPNGGTYSVVDESAQVGKSATYRLIELETSGATVVHGPYQVSSRPTLSRGQAYDELSKGATMARVSKSLSLGSLHPAALTSGRVVTASSAADRLRIQVTDSGLYKIVVADLVTGLRLTDAPARTLIRTKGLELTSRGKAVAYLPATDGSALYFYGKAIDSVYASDNVYWLRVGRGTAMTVVDGEPVLSATASAPVAATSTSVAPTTTTAPAETTTTSSTTSTIQSGASKPAGGLELSTEDTETTETTETTEPTETTESTEPVTPTSPPEPEGPATSFADSIHFEKDLVDVPTLFHDPAADIWLWDYLVAGYAPLSSKTVAVTAPDVVAGRNLVVQLQGLVTTGKENEHHVQVALNGTVLGEATWGGAVPHTATFDIPAGVLQSGENQVQIVALLDSGISYSLVGLDSLDVNYERSLIATADQLLFAPAEAGLTRVGGLSSSDAWILDLSNAALPRVMRVTGSGGDVGDAWVEFDALAADYLVATASGAFRPRAITAVVAPSIRSTSRGADYVVITSPSLAAAAGRLASYRTKDGFKTAVVTTSEIYDAFNNGIPSPLAIKDFISYAATKWRPAVRFVVLAGEGSYDYKDNLDSGDSLVPCVLVDSDDGLVASDVTLADNKGNDGVPEIAIGRIPAINQTELDAAIAKIKAYEAASMTQRTALLAADNPDSAGDFPADSDAIASLIPRSVRVSKAYLNGSNTPAVRSAVLSSFSSGTLLVNYVGHAAVAQLAEETIVGTADVPNLKTNALLPVVTALTCVAGQYGVPGYDGLSEALTMRANAGAIAMWAPTALEENTESVKLGKLFMKYLFGSSRTVRLGSAIQRTLQAGAVQKVPVGVLATYNLLGDPALKVRW